MKNVVISLGHACNLKCVFCTDGHQLPGLQKKIGIDKIKEEIDYFQKQGCRRAVFLGGEATIFPELPDIIRYARKAGFQSIEISTNGLRFSDRDYAKSILDAGVTKITMSIHSHIASIEEGLTRVPGTLSKKLSALRNLIDLRREGYLKDGLSLNPVITSNNYRHAPEYVRFFQKMEIDQIHFNLNGESTYTWPLGEELKESGLLPSYSELVPYIIKALQAGMKTPHIKVRFENVPPCVLPWKKASPKVCDFIVEGFTKHILTESWLSFDNQRMEWDRVARESFRVKGKVCRDCSFNDRCAGVSKAYASVHGFHELSSLGKEVFSSV